MKIRFFKKSSKDRIMAHVVSDKRGFEHLLFLRSRPAVVSRDWSSHRDPRHSLAGSYPKRNQDGFPITNVGNDGEKRFPPEPVGDDEREKNCFLNPISM